MTAIALLVLAATVVLVLANGRVVHDHEERIAKSLHADEPEIAWPPAALILCVRGGEAGLTKCLDRLAAVEYRDVEIHVVVDHVTDPSFDVAEAWQERHPEVSCHLHLLWNRSPHATLKCSAVDEALRRVSPRVEVVVVVDADTQVYPRWLQDMIRPVATAETTRSMATGNRWYDPTAPGLGSLIRFVYNANCIVPMHVGNMTWGGSLALRREVYTHPDFRPCLRQSPTEDATVRHAIDRCGQALACLPAVLLVTHDSIDVPSCLGFIRRQLLWTRLYHPGWSVIAGGAVLAYTMSLAITGAAVWSAWNGQPTSAIVFGGAILMAILGNLAAIERLHAAVSHAVHTRQGMMVPRIGWRTRLRLLIAIPLTLPAFCWAAVSATFAKEVTWSGVRYAVTGPGRIELVDYRPVASPVAPSPATGLQFTGAIAGPK